MRFSALFFASVALAARPYLEEPDTGIDDQLGEIVSTGVIAPLDQLVGLPDFEWAARHWMNISSFTYYRNGAAGEWSYRNNLEIFQRFRLRPRVMVDVTHLEDSFPTSILEHEFKVPFFIAPAAKAGYAHELGEFNLMRAAGDNGVLYMPSWYATQTIEDIAAQAAPGQVWFQQVYITNNMTEVGNTLKRVEATGAKAVVLAVDTAADGNRHRANRFGQKSPADKGYSLLNWQMYQDMKSLTTLPIILKGIQTVDDVLLAIENEAPAIYLSNHGGRQVDTSPSPLEVALEIYRTDPTIFDKIEIYADGGVRYGADVVKFLALGVRAVGVARPFMYANIYGQEGVDTAIKMLRHELGIDAGNIGIPNLKQIGPQYIDWSNSVNLWFS